MKKFTIMLFVLSLIRCTNVFAENVCQQTLSVLYCREGTVDNIDFVGNVNLDKTTVTHATNIRGILNGANAIFGTLDTRGATVLTASKVNQSLMAKGQVNASDLLIGGSARIVGNLDGRDLTIKSVAIIDGDIICKGCTFESQAYFKGDVEIINSEFNSNLELIALKSSFKNTKLKNVVVNIAKEDKPQTIILEGGSSVDNINFVNHKGTVYLRGNSRIIGAVTGGEILHV
jgi:cytoskeletal protein CcmA (bactofilin family)